MSNLDTATTAITQALTDLNTSNLAEIRQVFTATCAQHGGQQVFQTTQKKTLPVPNDPGKTMTVVILAAQFKGDDPGFVAALINQQTHEFAVVHSADRNNWPTWLGHLLHHVTRGITAALARYNGGEPN